MKVAFGTTAVFTFMLLLGYLFDSRVRSLGLEHWLVAYASTAAIAGTLVGLFRPRLSQPLWSALIGVGVGYGFYFSMRVFVLPWPVGLTDVLIAQLIGIPGGWGGVALCRRMQAQIRAT